MAKQKILSKDALNHAIGQRIADIRKARGLTLNQVVEHTRNKYSISQISNWEQGRRMPGIDDLLVLASILNVSPAFLSHFSDDPTLKVTKKTASQGVTVPLLSEDMICQHVRSTYFPTQSIIKQHAKLTMLSIDHTTQKQASHAAFAFNVNDDSMVPDIRQPGVVIVDPGKDIKHNTLVLAYLKKDKQLVIRRIHTKTLTARGQWIYHLFPNDPNYPIHRDVMTNKAKVIGRIIETRCYEH